MKKTKTSKCLAKQTKGITLIALVITIIVLLILAAVSITAVFGDNGLLKMARDAGDKTNEAVGKEQEGMENISGILGEYTNGNGGGTPTPKTTPKTVAEAVGQNYAFTENTDIQDAYGNPVTIPAGFRIVKNGESHVDYTYSGNGVPAVQDGIVIEDAEADSNGEKNQFVWIPVCTEEKAEDGTITIKRHIKNKAGDTARGDVRLARYEFAVGNYQSSTKTYDGTGEATPKQHALNYANTGEDTKIETYFQELENSTAGEKLKRFVEKTNEKGGYWFARYEAVKGEDGKAKSMASTVDSATSDSQAITAGMVWANITQPEASTKSRAMYEENRNFETDLVNSYAWDTAIVFIQTYSKGNSSYSKQSSINTTIGKTGERDGTTDKVCNIYDMASNLYEWSTETSTGPYNPCVYRGGCYRNSYYRTSYRGGGFTFSTDCVHSFRPLLYVKRWKWKRRHNTYNTNTKYNNKNSSRSSSTKLCIYRKHRYTRCLWKSSNNTSRI